MDDIPDFVKFLGGFNLLVEDLSCISIDIPASSRKEKRMRSQFVTSKSKDSRACESNGPTEPQDRFKESQPPISVEPQNGKRRATT